MSRSNDIIVKGGANYSAIAIAEKLSNLICEYFCLQPSQICTAVIGEVKYGPAWVTLIVNSQLVHLRSFVSHSLPWMDDY